MPSQTPVRSQSQPSTKIETIPEPPPDMAQAAADFSQGMQALMTALFNLQAALIIYYSRANPKGVIEAFQQSRNALRADWGKYIIFFKGCQAYADDYMALCQYSVTHRSSETVAFASDVLDMAKDLSREIRILQFTHGKACADLEKQIQKLPSEFRKPTTAGKEGSHDTLIEFPDASASPDGAQALRTANSALAVVRTSFRDLDIFWTDQVDQLLNASNPGSTFRLATQELKATSETWTRYRAALQPVVSSIAGSSDTVQADPAGAPSKAKPDRRSLWGRLLGFLCM